MSLGGGGGGGGGGYFRNFLVAYSRASSAEFCYPIIDLTPQIPLSLE